MIKRFYALEELFLKTKEKKELECTNLLGNVIKCSFKWNQPISMEKLKNLTDIHRLQLPADYKKFLLMANGAILYDDDENSGYQLLSLEEAIDFTKKKRACGFEGIKEEWLIFMVDLFDSNMLLFDMGEVGNKRYILDGIVENPEKEWKYLRWDFTKFMNLLFRTNGDNFWRW